MLSNRSVFRAPPLRLAAFFVDARPGGGNLISSNCVIIREHESASKKLGTAGDGHEVLARASLTDRTLVNGRGMTLVLALRYVVTSCSLGTLTQPVGAIGCYT